MVTDKTNAMRLLDSSKIPYKVFVYDSNETDGEKVAKLVGFPPEEVFKTLVTVADTREHFVFIVPVNEKLNLKLASKVAGVKNIEMIKQKDLLPLTGYVHGGCSPIAMKKKFITFIDETAILSEEICVSAGKKGCQIRLSPISLANFVGAKFVKLC